MILPPTDTPADRPLPQMASLKLVKGARSIHPSSASSSSSSPPSTSIALPPIQALDSAFQMSEYLQLLIQLDPHDVDKLVDLPEYFQGGSGSPPASSDGADESKGKRKQASNGSTNGNGKEVDLWILEHLRRLPIDLNPLLTSLLPVCTRSTCPEMRAGEWQYICVAHPAGGGPNGGAGSAMSDTASVCGDANGGEGANECCAIDYILHTIDSHTALLNSSHAFPSRLTIKPGSERHFGQQARRLSRVFSHAYYHHQDIFLESEAETSLYARFEALTKKYDLLSEDLLNIPKDVVEGLHKSRGGKEVVDETKVRIEVQSEDNDEDEAEFRRDVPKTSMKVGTLGRSAGRGRGGGKARRALFPVDVADEKMDDGDEGEEKE